MKYYFFLISIILLSFFSFYHAFGFAFTIDDWFQLWGVFYDKSIIDYYIKTQKPNAAFEFLIFAPAYKFNPFFYQLNGFFLKIVDSLTIALLIFSLTKSKKAGFSSGLIFASSVMGIETFTRLSAHNSALLIPSLCFGLFFWIEAKKDKTLYKYLIAILFFILTVIQDPGVGVMILPVVFLWDLLNLIRDFSKHTFRKFLITTTILILIPILLKWYLDPRIADRKLYITRHIYYLLNNTVSVITNFLTSIGNLILGWFIPFEEFVSLTTPNFLTTFAGYLAILFTILICLALLRKKRESLRIIFFFLVWAFLFYFPSFFTQSHYVAGGTISAVSNRYLAIPSIGIIGLISYLITFMRFKTRVIILILIISLNIFNSNKILRKQYTYRSLEVQNMLYNKIDQDLPRGEERDKTLVFLGNNEVKIVGLDWNGFYPLAIRRGITDKKEFPIIINNLADIKKSICGDESLSLETKLSRLYAWEVQNRTIYNISENVRLLIGKDCN